MNISIAALTRRRAISSKLIVLAFLVSFGLSLAAQEPVRSSADVQREFMHKLSFLAGTGSGPVTIHRGPGEPLHRTQTEDVQYKLDGLVMLIEGKSIGSDGKVMFNALATISYDDATHAYRFRAYNEGTISTRSSPCRMAVFHGKYQAGPAHIVNTMKLTKDGE